MISMLKRGLKRILNLKDKQKKHQHLIDSGNMFVGERSLINDLSIHAPAVKNGNLNIQIGKDSYIRGLIILHTENSKVLIGDRVFIGPDTTIFCYDEVEIRNDVMVSWGCTLIDTNAHSLNSKERETDVLDWIKGPQYKNWGVVESRKILIDQKCWIGFNSIIMKGVSLAEGTVVAAGSVVTKSFDLYSIIGGNPASFIKKTF